MLQSKLAILPEELINKIAAGEVVERPASVVKELVENALDAGAKRITVEVRAAGTKLVRVSDDGEGMSPSELKLAVLRHATSKISKPEDLFSISTLGFRGEALPAVAAVSRLEMFSCKRGSTQGAKIILEGGREKAFEDFGCPEGTTVAVKDLFFNTPARKKFLKAPATELYHVVNVVSQMILSHPAVALRLLADGKEILSGSGAGDLKEALAVVYGAELTQGFLEVKADGVWGYVSPPGLSRLDRKFQTFFVNGRVVKDFLLSRALSDAFENIIPRNRYPMAALFLEINPKEVDVNVHPTKREVKFAKPGEVLAKIKTAVAEVSNGLSSFDRQPQIFEKQFSPSWDAAAEKIWRKEIAEPAFDFNLGAQNAELRAESRELRDESSELRAASEDLPFSPLHQIDNTYIIAASPKEMILIDQHAAHERILFDRLTVARHAAELFSQALLVPENVNLPRAEAQLLEANLDDLRALGFEIEVFGQDTFAVRAVPASLGGVAVAELVKDLAAEYAALGKSAGMVERQNQIIKMLACKGAVKAGQKLSVAEMVNLLRDLFATENPHTCPHGRPTFVKYGLADLEKIFKRRGF